jgi:dTDP-4-amino-4,6-dideoxygalactose transaminase
MIRLTIPSIEEDDLSAVREAIASGFLVQGARVAAFEKEMAATIGVPHAIAVSNCTCALHLALLALEVKPGDICLVTAYSWVATANVIELCGARPVFVDIDPVTFNMDPEKLEEAFEKLRHTAGNLERVKAVLPVHTFGQMADMAAINTVSERYGVPVIEDAACALGAALHGRQAGTWGGMGCFSFHPRKAITTGEGGLITTSDGGLARRLKALRNHGLDPAAAGPDFILPGHNYRLTEFQAAMGTTQLQKLPRVIAARRAGAENYTRLLKDSALQTPGLKPGAEHVFQSYVATLPAEAAPHRADIIRTARERGVELQVGTIHMPLTTYYRSRYGYRTGDFPVTDDVAARSVTLPLFEGITPEQQQEVAEVLLSLVS